MKNIVLKFEEDIETDYIEEWERIQKLEQKVKYLQARCDEQELQLLEAEYGLVQDELIEKSKVIESLQEQLQEKDMIISNLQEQLKKNRVGRPSKYEQYYELINELYKKLGSATKVANELATMGIEISLRQVNNIIHMKLGNN